MGLLKHMLTTWTNLENITLREKASHKGQILHNFPYMRYWDSQNHRLLERMVVARCWGEGEWGAVL